MFKKLVYMTALSLALASSPDVSASGKCIVSGCSPYNSSSIVCNNISRCNNTGFLNFTKNYSITEYNKAFEKFSLAANVLAPFLSDAFFKIILDVFSCCDCIKYIKHRCTSVVLNAECNFENFLSSYWTESAIS